MEQKQNWLARPIHPNLPNVTNEIVIFVAILVLAVATRFYNLGARVMSHDESLHTYFSWLLYRGQGYEHSPMMHGPWQFHWIALSYFLFGASDYTARIPAATFSIMMIAMMWFWRRFIGKTGGLIAAFLMVISPMMLYYGRYVREDVYACFSGVLMLYTVLRYLESGERKFLYLFVGALAIHFMDKETSYIYTAQLLIFLSIYFIAKVTRQPWKDAEQDFRFFIIGLAVAILVGGAAVGYGLYMRNTSTIAGSETALPANPAATAAAAAAPTAASPITPTLVFLLIALIAAIVAVVFLIRGYTWERIRNERSFDLLMVSGTIVLPMLSPLLVNALERWLKVAIPTDAQEVQAMTADMRSVLIIVGFLILMFGISIAIGLLWNKEKWWKTALIFWIPYTILYTTIFTNSDGFFTGTIGSLGYWLAQQGVARGSQPWYFYVLIQIPIYEFLPALGLILAIIIGLRRTAKSNLNTEEDVVDKNHEVINLLAAEETDTEEKNFQNTFSLLVFWSIMTIITLTIAGERMPWLTIHMTWPMIIITGWALGRIVDTTDWAKLSQQKIPLTLAAVTIFVISIMGMMLALGGSTPPFQGQELAQLQATSAFLLPTIVAILSAVAVTYFFKQWTFSELRNLFVLVVFAILAVLTGRAAFRASYINYDQATEFLVYAHGATGIKEIIQQATEISERTTGGMGVSLAYDASAPNTGVSWPFVWYLRDFTNQHSFDQPTRALRDSVVVIVDEKNFDKIEPALGPGYYRVDYIRMWWPMQDYFDLVHDRDASQPFPDDYACNGLLSVFKLIKSKDFANFCEGFTNPQIRAGIFQIWLNRDYTEYAQAKGRTNLTLATWEPSAKMRLYIRKDVASQIWNYGLPPAPVAAVKDPTEGKFIQLAADLIFNVNQPDQTPLNAPRSLAVAGDGSIYVADSRNHRVVHLDTEGKIIHQWGTFADGASIPVANGTFNEPWGIAIGTDGSVYVTDTWNHRIEKFTPDGQFITAWGIFGQGETPESFYGPRGLAVDSEGRVYVTDTGNKRISVFDSSGKPITQFGSGGLDPGQFDEPVGITVDKNGTVYVVDTWNQRIQTFTPVETDGNLTFVPAKQWDVYGWFGQSLDNKPFIAVNDALHVFVTDPDGYRIMEFDPNGTLLRVWGEPGDLESSFGLPSGIAIDNEGHVWVADAGKNRLMRFTTPP